MSELSFNFHLKIQENSRNRIASEFFYHAFQIAFGNSTSDERENQNNVRS